jgi:hypothetical protein
MPVQLRTNGGHTVKSPPAVDPVVALVANAIGYGVMLALEGKDILRHKLESLPPGSTLFDAVIHDAEEFAKTRSDLVDALTFGLTKADLECAGDIINGECWDDETRQLAAKLLAAATQLEVTP